MYAGKIFTLAPKPLVPKKKFKNFNPHTVTLRQKHKTLYITSTTVFVHLKTPSLISLVVATVFPLPPFFTFVSLTDHDPNSSYHRRFLSQA
jgi:hypothetical protein